MEYTRYMHLVRDYDSAYPVNNSYYLPLVYQKRIPQMGSYDYFRFLDLLKFLELQGSFKRESLSEFTEDI